MVEPLESERLRDPQGGLRVLHVVPGEPDGNAMIFARRQIRSLHDEGIQCHTFYLRSRTSLPLLIREYFRLRQEIAAFGAQVIHAHFGTMTAFLCAIAGRIPLVITFRGSDLNRVPSAGRMRSFAGRILSHLAAVRAAAIICVSEQLKQKLWWRKNGLAVIPSGVSLDRFRPMPKEMARAALEWNDSRPVVLFNAGREPMVKRLDLAEESVHQARTEIKDIRFVILRGDIDPELVPFYLNAADCVLFTSDWEGSPNIIKEALACNVRVVSVDVGDVCERLNGVAGCMVVSRDAREIGHALATLLRQEGRSNGRDRALAFSESAIARNICDLYRRVATSSSRAAAAVAASPTST